MQIERNFQFRERLGKVHETNRRDPARKPVPGQVVIDNGWIIRIAPDAHEVIVQVATDLQDYFQTSQLVSVTLKRESLSETPAQNTACIEIGTRDDWPDFSAALEVPGSYRISIAAGRIRVCGKDPRGASQGCYYLEDLMNFAEAPFLEPDAVTRKPLFSPRMVHSGWGMDVFPDAHLNAMAHAGMDAVLVYAKGVNMTSHGFLDFNDLIRRAGRYGIGVYFYSTLRSLKHPDDPEADAYYAKTYGELFKACPGARGVTLVGESCEFPSKDPNTTGKSWREPTEDGFPALKPSPGWWPVVDFSDWVECLKRAIFPHCPNADIVVWTYNWGWAPVEERLKLLQKLPKDVSVQATFEMSEDIPHGDITHRTCDYTISYPGPGRYFASEAEEAHRLGLRLYTMANTAGMTWDVGVVPYIPVPQQWAKRHAALRKAHDDWGLCGLMESHHFGFYPSCVNELAKWAFWDPAPNPEEILGKIAERDFGPAGAPHAIRAWQIWSDAMNEDYACTNEDQYGPFRIGPSYPLVFHPNLSRTHTAKAIKFPASEYAYFGARILFTEYRQMEAVQQTAGMRRLLHEQKMTENLRKRWEQGVAEMEKAVAGTPEFRREQAQRTLALGRFILHAIITVGHVKEWYRLNMKLRTAETVAEMQELLDALVAVGEAEIRNAEAAIPVVESDSRLGWEPSMEYMTDAPRIRWKIRQVERTIYDEIPLYRKAVDA